VGALRFLLTFLLLLASSAVAFADDIHFRLHTPEQIMDRLKQAAEKNEDRQETLKQLFRAEECTADRLAEQPVKREKLGNVICTLPGQTDDVILVSAHFDKVKPGMGVTDNWSGASLLPSLLYGVNGVPRKHTYVFIGFTGEEDGLVGSIFYTSHLTKEQRAKIKAVINMDTLGLGPTEVWLSRADSTLVNDLVAVAHTMNIAITGMNVDRVGSTDSEAFWRYKIPRMTIHSLTQDTLGILHTDKDQMSVIKPNDYYDSYRLITVFLAYLDGKLTTSTAQPSSGSDVK
jgi:putative aminopeptidase FrvX